PLSPGVFGRLKSVGVYPWFSEWWFGDRLAGQPCSGVSAARAAGRLVASPHLALARERARAKAAMGKARLAAALVLVVALRWCTETAFLRPKAQAAASTAGAGAWLWAVQEAAARRQYLPGADDPEPPVPTEDLSSDQVLATFGMAPSKRSGERRMDGPEGRSS
ncbi:unnamed protein product, partial [Effrenium voratum]